MIESILGRVLRGVRAGEKGLAWNDRRVAEAKPSIALSSAAFENGGRMPERFAGKGVGANISPPLSWENVPDGTVELVLIVEDPDAPLPRPFVHLIAAGIDPEASGVQEGAFSKGLPRAGIRLGRNGLGKTEYAGPRPLQRHGPHRYVFQLLALNAKTSVDGPLSKSELIGRLEGSVIGRGRLDGVFERR
jgi:Raf kinase inhibitor-like YbhB/YbcL family protein